MEVEVISHISGRRRRRRRAKVWRVCRRLAPVRISGASRFSHTHEKNKNCFARHFVLLKLGVQTVNSIAFFASVSTGGSSKQYVKKILFLDRDWGGKKIRERWMRTCWRRRRKKGKVAPEFEIEEEEEAFVPDFYFSSVGKKFGRL